MVPVVGIVVCLYVFVRSLDMASNDGTIPPVRFIAAAVAVAAFAGVPILVRAALDARDALNSIPPF